MAKCKRCEKSLGMFSVLYVDYCDPCYEIVSTERELEQARLEKEQALLEKEQELEKKKQLEEHNLYRANIIQERINAFRRRIDDGEVFYFYQSIYLSVDSVVVDEIATEEFCISELQHLGFNGWDIAGTVPKTLGVGLKNSSIGSSSGITWGAGIGGNVVGVHILLRKEISKAHSISDSFLETYITINISLFLTENESQILREILSGKTTLAPTLADR